MKHCITISLTVLCLTIAPGLVLSQLPPEFDHLATTVDGNLSTTVAATHHEFAAGETIDFVLVVENVGAEPVTIQWPVEYPDAVVVTPASCADVAACVEDIVFSVPNWLFYVPGSQTLAPGEMRTRTYSWDTVAEPAAPGLYTVWGGLVAWPTEYAGMGEWISAPALLTIELGEPVSSDEMAWDQIKARYLD